MNLLVKSIFTAGIFTFGSCGTYKVIENGLNRHVSEAPSEDALVSGVEGAQDPAKEVDLTIQNPSDNTPSSGETVVGRSSDLSFSETDQSDQSDPNPENESLLFTEGTSEKLESKDQDDVSQSPTLNKELIKQPQQELEISDDSSKNLNSVGAGAGSPEIKTLEEQRLSSSFQENQRSEKSELDIEGKKTHHSSGEVSEDADNPDQSSQLEGHVPSEPSV